MTIAAPNPQDGHAPAAPPPAPFAALSVAPEAEAIPPEPRADDARGPHRSGQRGALSRIDMEIARIRPYPTSKTGAGSMGIFSRTRDIIAANITDMLDRAEDPAKMIRLIIVEMEETLVEVRSSAARTIADQKEMRRHIAKLERFQADWGEKAELALSKDREDLARAALVEKRKAGDMIVQLETEIVTLDDSMRAYEDDIEKLQARLREARARQRSITTRLESAEHRVRMRTLMSSERVDAAMSRFEQLERRVDYAEGRAEAMNVGGRSAPTLAEEIAALESGDQVDRELEALKRDRATRADPKP